jgi:hypothetical protein
MACAASGGSRSAMTEAALRMASSGPAGSRSRRTHQSMYASMTTADNGCVWFRRMARKAVGPSGFQDFCGILAGQRDRLYAVSGLRAGEVMLDRHALVDVGDEGDRVCFGFPNL